VQGWWYQAISNGLSNVFTLTFGQWSANWQMRMMDLNGDAKADVLLLDRATGLWYQAWTTTPPAFGYSSGLFR
jgi:hypothetical protein